jgi:hypothetical protein
LFDEGGRVEPFSGFRDETQFDQIANSFAERAATEVIRYRKLFPNVHKVCAYYLQHPPNRLWPCFHAAIACALAGQADHAHRLFKQVTDAQDDGRDWIKSTQTDASRLSPVAKDIRHFRSRGESRTIRLPRRAATLSGGPGRS